MSRENCHGVATLARSRVLHTTATQPGDFEALEQDGRYADVAFLEENLWGNRLIGSTNEFLCRCQDIKSLTGRAVRVSPSGEDI